MGHHLHHHEHAHHKPRHESRRAFLSSVASAIVFAPWAFGQQQNPADLAERYRQMSEDAEREGLAEPFKGITTNGHVLPGLFEISPTGVSTEPVRIAAEKFIASLSSVQLARTLFPVDDIEWRKWMNKHYYVRQGTSFQEMTDTQREAAFGLLRASLSAKGLQLTRNIMRLNETLAELRGDHDFLGEWLYFITIMGVLRPRNPGAGAWTATTTSSIISFWAIRWS